MFNDLARYTDIVLRGLEVILRIRRLLKSFWGAPGAPYSWPATQIFKIMSFLSPLFEVIDEVCRGVDPKTKMETLMFTFPVLQLCMRYTYFTVLVNSFLICLQNPRFKNIKGPDISYSLPGIRTQNEQICILLI